MESSICHKGSYSHLWLCLVKQELPRALGLRDDSCFSILKLFLAVEDAERSYLVKSDLNPFTVYFAPQWEESKLSAVFLVKPLPMVEDSTSYLPQLDNSSSHPVNDTNNLPASKTQNPLFRLHLLPGPVISSLVTSSRSGLFSISTNSFHQLACNKTVLITTNYILAVLTAYMFQLI